MPAGVCPVRGMRGNCWRDESSCSDSKTVSSCAHRIRAARLCLHPVVAGAGGWVGDGEHEIPASISLLRDAAICDPKHAAVDDVFVSLLSEIAMSRSHRCEHAACLCFCGMPGQVVWCGDMNVCHLDADIWNVGAKHLAKSAGTTKEERESFANSLAEVLLGSIALWCVQGCSRVCARLL